MNLIIQATRPISDKHLDQLAKLAQSKQREQISAHAFRLTDTQAHPEIAPYCLANPARLRLCSAWPLVEGYRAGGDGHGFHADHHRVH